MPDFDDITPTPDPTPKKRYLLRPGTNGVPQPFPWPAGQTFVQAISAALPAAIKNKTNLTEFTVTIVIDAKEV